MSHVNSHLGSSGIVTCYNVCGDDGGNELQFFFQWTAVNFKCKRYKSSKLQLCP